MPPSPSRWLAYGLLPLLCLVIAFPAAADNRILMLDEADFVLDTSATPPDDGAAWTAQTLPDQWVKTRPLVTSGGWYRFRFDASTLSTDIQAVYLPRLAMNAAVFLNGVTLGDGGRMEEPVSRNWNRPLLFLIPPGVLRPGENTLHARLATVPNSQSILYPVRIGPENLLRAEYEDLFFIRITFNQTLSLLIAATGVLMLSLWWRRRQDTMYAYFGASALTWALNSTNLYARDIPIPNTWWEVGVNASLPVFVAMLMLSLLRFTGLAWRRFELLLWLLATAAPLSLALVPAGQFLALTKLLHLAALTATIIVSVAVLRMGWRMRDTDTLMLGGSIWFGFLFGLHDWLMHSKLLPQLWYAAGQSIDGRELHLVHYAAPLVFLVVGWIMTARFVRALNAYEQLNTELEERVAAKHAELEANYARLNKSERERAALEERERLMSDMHDGLGGQLVTALRVVEADRDGKVDVAQLLRECLDEMRLVVNSLAADHTDLAGLLADLRYRMEPRLTKAGIALDWHAHAAPPLEALAPRAVLEIQRVVQEAITNVIKHAGARTLRIEAGATEHGARAFVRIADDGHGMQGTHQGRGLINMRKRAQRIGGELEIESGASGATVTLWLPLAVTAPPT